MWERYARKDIATQRLLPSGLLALASAGFRLAHLPLFAFAAPWPPRAINPQEPLPPFEEVTPAMARHDLASLDFREVRAAGGLAHMHVARRWCGVVRCQSTVGRGCGLRDTRESRGNRGKAWAVG